MQKIMVLNVKGGCGKTTIATNLAACYASRGSYPALLDYDPQASASKWLDIRPEHVGPIHGIAAHKQKLTITRSWQMRMPPQIDRVIIDTPAALGTHDLTNFMREANVILIPVLPSPIDIHATTAFIEEILVIGKMRSSLSKDSETRIGVVANRVSDNTKVYQSLQGFLAGVNLPFVTALSDSHYYVHAFVEGVGIHEVRDSRTHLLRQQWLPLLNWIEDPGSVTAMQEESIDPKKFA
jgi:chromosome partitioning protein